MEIALAIILLSIQATLLAQCYLLDKYLKRKKPGPKPRARSKPRTPENKQPAAAPPRIRRTHRARDYPEIPMK